MTAPSQRSPSELLDSALTFAAGHPDGVHHAVMTHFYTRFPPVLASFETHGLGDRERLEAEMMDAVFYCIMHWPDRPEEIRFMFSDQVVHHVETLKVDLDWFRGLIDATFAVIAGTLPAGAAEQAAMCDQIRADLQSAVAWACLAIRQTQGKRSSVTDGAKQKRL